MIYGDIHVAVDIGLKEDVIETGAEAKIETKVEIEQLIF